MPPVGFRKREHSPEPTPPSKRPANSKSKPVSKPRKPTFEDLSASGKKVHSVEENKKLLEQLAGDDDDVSLSDIDSDAFEDVPPPTKQKTTARQEDGIEGGSDQNEMDWEDAIDNTTSIAGPSNPEPEIGDIDISLNEDGVYVEPLVSLATGKKGPSKRERQIRILTHCLHVQALMWHNTVRNSWLNDEEVQKTLVDGMPQGVQREVTRWRGAMGTLTKEELEAKKAAAAKAKGRKGKQAKGKGRDWNYDAEHLEQGVPNLSQGDPLLRLLKVLTAYWRKRFTVTAPAIRKLGYMPLRQLRDELKHWEKNRGDAEGHGERIADLIAFRELAKRCEGSKDVGGQLFAALLRGIGLNTRMVANLQPAGIGWSKSEDVNSKKPKKDPKASAAGEDSGSDNEQPTAARTKSASMPDRKFKNEKPSRKSARGDRAEPINLDDSDSPLSDPPSDDEGNDPEPDLNDDDDLSIIEITPTTPKKKPSKKYDRDMAFPTYWTEVCSSVSHKWVPVDPIVLSTIASNDELLQTFEPRGKRAELAKQVICYTIAYSADGTAKDVTVRYLKKHQLPGKTKGMRMPAEKVPIYNKHGKVKKYEEYDWFKTLMSGYERRQPKRTAADDLEEQTVLKPFKPAKEAKEVEKESLQWYKQSADYVLEQHLRREEALIPGAKPVRTFTAGKGDKAQDHPVYKRSDVVSCKTVESWHKEGREVKFGEQPYKHVPVRAVTLARKREMEETLRETGEKMTQGLYSWNQTDWIIPPPVENGVIPKNAFGNMDVYVDTMVPEGAIHLPLKGSAAICRKLDIDYAEACTGFEFGKQRAVPILTGVVVAEEHEILVRDAWREVQKEKKRKEDTKRTASSFHWWRKMLMGMRIVDRMQAEYDQADRDADAVNPFARKAKKEGREAAFAAVDNEAAAGGFFRPGHDEEEVAQHRSARKDDIEIGGGFMAGSEDEAAPGDGGFLVEDVIYDGETSTPAARRSLVTPVSLQSMHKDKDNSDSGEERNKHSVSTSAKRTSAKKISNANTVRSTKTHGGGPLKKKTSLLTPSRDETEDSSLSDLDSSSSEEDAPPSRKYTSPKVVASRSNRIATPGRRTRGRAEKKTTPVRSQYFTPDVDEDEEDDDEESSDQEVVKPSRTTARTRSAR